ncbi:MAG: alpha/beta fold hydrolase [Opitutaceae bacterium]|nr:alpha/beta fold hydrolase [Opitutaceae bacterium]
MVSIPAQLPDWLRELYPFAPRRLALPGGEMSYVDEGTGEEAVVMVHGNPTWSFFYRNLVRALRGRFRCIVPDHLGCGLSDKPQGYEYALASHIANIETLLRHAGLKRWHLVVHDWGGPIGLGAALRNPLGLGRVVIMNTAAFRGPMPVRIRLCRMPVLGALIVRGLNGFAGPATSMAVTRPLTTPVKRGYLFPYDNWRHRIAVHRFVRDIPLGQGGASDPVLDQITAHLPQLTASQVMLLWGAQDFCFNRFYYDRWCDYYPAAEKHYLATAGHYLLEDAPEECGRLIGTFLSAPGGPG